MTVLAVLATIYTKLVSELHLPLPRKLGRYQGNSNIFSVIFSVFHIDEVHEFENIV